MKTLKTLMVFLTAMTMTAGAMGVTAYAAETNTAVIAENIQTEGIFSQGAKYHFIKGSDTLILDGEGTFTAEDFDEIAMQFSPRAIVFGDSVDIPDSGSANNTWLKGMLELSSPYAVYAHKSGNINKSYKKMIDTLEDDLKAKGLNPEEVKIWIYYKLNYLDDDADIYNDFTYEQVIVDKGAEMEMYLKENDVREEISREIVSYYMYGLNKRVQRGKEFDDATEIANPDGSEVNEKTTQWICSLCLNAAQGEQDLIDNANSKPLNDVSQFLAENGIHDNENKRITLMYVNGCKKELAFSWFNVKTDEEYGYWQPYLPSEPVKETQHVEETTKSITDSIVKEEIADSKEIIVNSIKELKASSYNRLKGDMNDDGKVSYRDAAILALLLASKSKSENDELPQYADFNEDGIINIKDVARIIVHCKENGSLGEEYRNMTTIQVKKGDADLNGTVDLSDLVTVSKYNLSNEAYPLINEIAFVNADMNDDDVVDGLDTSALIENQLGK